MPRVVTQRAGWGRAGGRASGRPARALAALAATLLVAGCSALIPDTSWDEGSVELHRVTNRGQASAFQLLHLPRVERNGRSYTVTVDLPMTVEHRIETVRVYRGNSFLAEQVLPQYAARAEAVFSIDAHPGELLRFIAKCNKHGLWETVYEVP